MMRNMIQTPIKQIEDVRSAIRSAEIHLASSRLVLRIMELKRTCEDMDEFRKLIDEAVTQTTDCIAALRAEENAELF